MFVRIKTTPNSPRKSVQIVQSVRKGNKISQRILRHVGIAMDDYELEKLKLLAESIKVKLEAENQALLFTPDEIAQKTLLAQKNNPQKLSVRKGGNNDKKTDKLEEKINNSKFILDNIKQSSFEDMERIYNVDLRDLIEEDRVVSGIHDVYGKIFDELGYEDVLENPARHKYSVRLFKEIVLARIANPLSKRASVNMLEEDFGVSLNLDDVYQMMDKLNDNAITRLNRISYENTRKLYGQKIDVIFFDCTTLYFEAFEEDELRKLGYSKDNKFNQVQVLLSLMVTKDGLPIGYQAYEGSMYEGHTLIPAIKDIKSKYQLDRIVFVADAGLFNQDNLSALELEGIEYIVGSRLKNLPKNIQTEIFNKERYTQIDSKNALAKLKYQDRNLIVNYNTERARKDAHDRDKAIKKLQEKLKKQKNPKAYLANFGYKKYLTVNGKASFELNAEKIKTDSKWDGLLGVITNSTNFTSQEILNQYRNLWQVEEAFRVTKHDLKIRPVYHWKPSRVRAHLAICFTAYSLVKYLEYRIKLQYIKLSPEVIRQTLIRVQTSILFDKKRKIRYGLPSKMSEYAKKIYQFLNIDRQRTPYFIEKL